MTHDEEEDLPLEQLDQDAPGDGLMGAIRDTKAVALPEPDWEKVDEKLFGRINEDDLPTGQLDLDAPNELLAQAIQDATKSEPPQPDWQKVDTKLFARIGRERKTANVVWLGFAGALAAAAAAALWMGQDNRVEPGATAAPIPQVVGAGWLSEHRGAGEIRVDGTSIADGQKIAVGNRIEAVGEVGVFERPERVRWLLESGGVASVASSEGALVLSLERGAAEAQVIPVPNGEAFAIDMKSAAGNTVRVAVHGTHLRVARTNDHVVVDLTEGVVSIGAPPKRGSTLGELVTAPAHVELDIDAYSTLSVQHADNAVRGPVSLAPDSPMIGEAALNVGTAPPRPAVNPQTNQASPRSIANVDPQAALLARVQKCFEDTPHSQNGNVVTLSGSIDVTLFDSGAVRLMVFRDEKGQQVSIDTPVMNCISTFAFDDKAMPRFPNTGNVMIPLHVTHR